MVGTAVAGSMPAARRRHVLEPEIGDSLHAAALGDREVVFRQILDGHVVPIGHDDIELDVVDAGTKHRRRLGGGGLALRMQHDRQPQRQAGPRGQLSSHIAIVGGQICFPQVDGIWGQVSQFGLQTETCPQIASTCGKRI